MLLETLRALADRPAEVDARNRGALPPGGLDGQPAGAEGRDPKVGQVLERADEARRGDDVVDLDREVGSAIGPPQMRGQAGVPDRLDPIHRRVEDADAATEDEVLEWLHVARPHTNQRLRVDRQLGPGWRHEDQLACPRQHPGRELEPRVLLADDEHAMIRVSLDRPDVRVVMAVLHADARWSERLSHADRQDKDATAVDPVGRLDLEGVAVRRLHPTRRGPAAAVADRDLRAL